MVLKFLSKDVLNKLSGELAAPLDVLHQGQQTAGVADEFVQEGDHVGELGPMASLLLPAVQHELVQGHGAAHGCGQPVALLDGQDHLQGAEWSSVSLNRSQVKPKQEPRVMKSKEEKSGVELDPFAISPSLKLSNRKSATVAMRGGGASSDRLFLCAPPSSFSSFQDALF